MSLYDDLLAAGLPVELLPDGGYTFTRSIDETETQLYHDILDPAEKASREAYAVDRAQLKAEYQATVDQLQAIENATSPTNAQVIAAVKFIAKTLRLLLKLLARMI